MSSRGRKRLVTVFLLALGAILLIIGIAIHRPENRSEFISLFLEHLGIGLFAVTVLKISIEEAAQEQFLNLLRTDVKEQVGTTVISFIRRSDWILKDKVLKKELEDSILLPNFTRPLYNLTLKLEPLENHEELLKVWITLEYVVKNISNEARSYPVGAWLDDLIQLDDLAPQSRPGFKTISIGKTNYPIESLTNGARPPGAGRILREEQMIQLKDLPTPLLNPEGSVSVSVTGMQIMRSADHFVWNLPTITHKLGLTVKLDGGLTFDQLEICPREMHHVPHEEFINTEKNPEPNTREFSIGHVVLPFQGVELRWAPKRHVDTSTPVISPPSTTVPVPQDK